MGGDLIFVLSRQNMFIVKTLRTREKFSFALMQRNKRSKPENKSLKTTPDLSLHYLSRSSMDSFREHCSILRCFSMLLFVKGGSGEERL
jgi:hypothetical protein